jgi:hypothetical protein
LDVRTFQDIRAAVNDEIQNLVKNEKGDAARKLQVVKSAMDKELETFANKSGGSVKQAFDVANRYYQEGAQVFHDPKIKRIIESNPESVYGLLVKPNAVTDINTLRKALGEENFKPVQRAFMEKVLATDGVDVFSPAKFSTSAGKFEPETLNAVFGAQKVKEIQDFWTLAQRITQVEKRVGNPSGTAQNIITPAYWSGTAALMLHNPVAGGTMLLSPPALAKLYTSPLGMKFLTEAVQTASNSPRAVFLANRITGILSSKDSDTKLPPDLQRIERDIRMKNALKQKSGS